jgi:hypothetical protein
MARTFGQNALGVSVACSDMNWAQGFRESRRYRFCQELKMSQNPQDKQAVRRIVLPSGRTIEVIRFHEVETDRRPLHVCPTCESDLVQPLSWNETTDGQWDLTLECPNCGWADTGTFSRLQVERLEDHLDEGLTEMIADLQRLTQANMAADIDRFVAALDAGLILPEDF